VAGPNDPHRCRWATQSEPEARYHDAEWGVPERDERRLFELLTLEGAQAGLSWAVVLRKRDGYRRLFEGFDPERVARFTPADVERLLADPGIVRHRGKVEATVGNAAAVLALRASDGGLAEFLWGFVDGRPLQNRWPSHDELPAQTPLSARMSRELRRRGFRFVGPTICYSLMQAAGLINDHETGCFRHAQLAGGD